jgi:hypothetical protein
MALKRFRIVLRADSHFRLMERPGDDPMTWNLNMMEPDDEMTAVSIRDEVMVRGKDLPVHVGLVIIVETGAHSLEEAVDKGEGDAAVALGLLSAAARAPTSNRRLLLAYDITPGRRAGSRSPFTSDAGQSEGNGNGSLALLGPVRVSALRGGRIQKTPQERAFLEEAHTGFEPVLPP